MILFDDSKTFHTFRITIKECNAVLKIAPPDEDMFPRAEYPELWETQDKLKIEDFIGKASWNMTVDLDKKWYWEFESPICEKDEKKWVIELLDILKNLIAHEQFDINKELPKA